MRAFSPRERLLAAIRHEETDRVPIDLGGYLASVHKIAYANLIDYLKLPLPKLEPWDRVQQIVDVDESILRMFEVDTRHIRLNPPDGYTVMEPTPDSYVDEWGITRKFTGMYSDIVKNPLAEATVADLDSYPWPDPADPGRFRGLREKAKDLYFNTEFAVIGDPAGYGLVELGCGMRGYEQFLIDLALENQFFTRFLDVALGIMKTMWMHYLHEVGDYLQAVWLCDDFGTQQGMLFSPHLFRKHIKPRYKELVQHIKSIANVKVLHHSCGSIVAIIDDLIEIGIDVLNPVQPLAKGMQAESIKEQFGSRLAFHGAIDVQQLMPRGTPEMVFEEARRIITIMSKGGGYIFAPGHNIQPDVPPENIVALLRSPCAGER